MDEGEYWLEIVGTNDIAIAKKPTLILVLDIEAIEP